MKKLCLFLLGFASFVMHAQADTIVTLNVKTEVLTKYGETINVSADKMTVDNLENTIAYTGVQLFTVGNVEIRNAEKILYNIGTNELILTGSCSLNGVSIHSELPFKGKSKHLRYRIGDTVAYME